MSEGSVLGVNFEISKYGVKRGYLGDAEVDTAFAVNALSCTNVITLEP